MAYFIFRECMLFFRIFWGFFHFSLNPTGEIGLVWPPTAVQRLNAFRIPFLNLLILVRSGLTLTIRHYLLVQNSILSATWLIVTICLGVLFTSLQVFEYFQRRFTMMRANYGSIFFMSTGFHGAHVIIGTVLLMTSLYKLLLNRYRFSHHTFFELRIWYWHFVDLVWLFLFGAVYWWAR